MDYIFHLIITCCIYMILAGSSSLLIGMANLVSLCQAAFYGMGAYVTTLCLITLNLSLLPTLLIIFTINGAIAFILSLPSLKMRGDYFVIATMGFQLIIYAILYNWTSVTKGPFGISNIPAPRLIGGAELSSPSTLVLLGLILSGIVLFLIYHLIESPFGRVLKAMREDEVVLLIIGRDPRRFKILAFVLSSAFISWSGFLFAVYIGYIDPTSFSLDESIFILSAVLIGGTGNIKGPVLGAVFVVILPELFRFIGFGDNLSGPLRQICYGSALLIVMYFKPQGIAGIFKFK